jgi:hypothetical protein
MRFALLLGCLSLGACAAFVTVKLRGLDRKLPSFAPIYSFDSGVGPTTQVSYRHSKMGR